LLPRRFVWAQSLLVFTIAALAGVASVSWRGGMIVSSGPSSELLSGFEGLEDALHAMIIFMLGLFLSEVLRRRAPTRCKSRMGVFRRATMVTIVARRARLLLSEALWAVALKERHDGGVNAQDAGRRRAGRSILSFERLAGLGLRANPSDFLRWQI